MSALLQRVRDFFQPRSYHVTYVEGNIGAGKSTVLATLEGQHPNIKVVPENVEKFTLLQSRYRHPDRFFFSSQVQIAFVHYQTIQNALRTIPPGSRVVVERSIESSLIFAQLGVQHNYISNDEYKLLALLVECLQTKLNAEFNIVNSHVYIVCDPLQCYRQAVLRNRAAEHTLQQADVSHLHQMHEVFCQGQIRVSNAQAEDVQDIVNTIVCI